MNLDDVMDALGAQLTHVSGPLQISSTPGGPIIAPSLQIQYPEWYKYDATYGRGSDEMEIPILALVSTANPTAARKMLSDLVEDVKNKVEYSNLQASNGAPWDEARVTEVSFSTETLGGVQYAIAEFTVHIVGTTTKTIPYPANSHITITSTTTTTDTSA